MSGWNPATDWVSPVVGTVTYSGYDLATPDGPTLTPTAAEIGNTIDPIIEFNCSTTDEKVAGFDIQTRQTSVPAVITQLPPLNGTTVYGVIGPLLPGTSYDVQCRTFDGVGNFSPWSSWVTATTTANGNTSNNTYIQGTDPALSATVPNGALWSDTSTSQLFIREAGAWVLVANLSTIPDGTVLYTTQALGAGNFTIPTIAPAFCEIRLYAPAGGGYTVISGGGGGGGGGGK
jgi:hypothetical protein